MYLPKLPILSCIDSPSPGLLATDGIGNFDGIFPCICESHPNPGKVKNIVAVGDSSIIDDLSLENKQCGAHQYRDLELFLPSLNLYVKVQFETSAF